MKKIFSLLIPVILLTLILSSCFYLRNFTLSIQSNPENVNISIDGQDYITPFSSNLTFGQHTIEVFPTYSTFGSYGGSPNVEYLFSNWSDGSTQNPRIVNLEGNLSLTANMIAYYAVKASSNIGITIASSPYYANGFYPAYTFVQLTAPSESGFVFDYWIVNGQTTTGNPLSQYVSLPIEATAIYVQIVPPSIASSVYPESGSVGLPISLNLRWSAYDSNNFPITYSLYFGTSQNPPLIASGLSTSTYEVSNLNYSTTYYWYVIATNGYASTKGPLWSFTTQNTSPSNPTGLYYTNVTSNSVSLAWSPSPLASGYNIYRSTNGVNFSKISSTPNTYYTDTNLSPSTTYYYAVTAYNPFGESGYSNQITVTTQSAPEPAAYGIVNGRVSVYTGQSAFVSSAPVYQNKWQIQKYTGPDYVPGQIIVGFKSGIRPNTLSLYPSPFKYNIVSTLQTPNYEVNASLITVSTSVERAIDYFKSLPNVAYAEPNYIVHALSIPNDPDFGKQWYLQNIEAPQAWNVSTGANTVIVAVVDTGVSSTHPDLQNILVPGYNFVNNTTNTMDDFGHGTFVAGIIDADTNNGVGIAGINWGGPNSTKIMPIVVLGPDGSGSVYNVSEGIIYSVEHGAKVINLSLGGPNYTQTEELACQYAYNNNVVVVAAAGNNSSNTLDYPAAFPTVIPVASVAPSGSSYTLAYYSNYSSTVICAPGGQMNSQNDPNGVFSTTYSTSTNTNGYGYNQGTSFAAPQVSAIAALMIAHNITGVANITKILENTATYIGPQSTFGYGLVNAYNAVTYNGGWEPMIVWAQNASGIVATAVVSPNGSFSMKVPVGNYYVYAWQDFNGDNQIDQGDLYGYYGYSGTQSTPLTLSVNANQTYNLNIQVSPEVSTPPSVYGISVLDDFIQNVVKAHYQNLRSSLQSSR
ncbi:S8 family serine peptidase [Athalassotoga saccharophila]|uniref:S8 family serine peptidase n=1 Tax=Athalassotoga saccharophila TaxID=1441386 RepID=UPI00137989B9|nr:S8 family serine peptidase [Athalassotoga saccharophila]BBJ28280.1 thermophilic serine proteinase [Athalassotoga saccharophila]